MKRILLAAPALLFSFLSHAVIINKNEFFKNGGDVNDIPGSIVYANEELRAKSYSKDFLSVGKIYGCTATWLGNDDLGWTYILTAAHCLPYEDEVTPINRKFTSWDGRVIAQGDGFIYVPKERINKPEGFGGASTDIAILKLPTLDILTDQDGNLVNPPIINDEFNEKGQKVVYAGYGTWGVGNDISGSYKPTTGARRLYGESIVTDTIEMDHGLRSKYEATGDTAYWARVAPGDSGSAWWQDVDGFKVIIATTNGGASNRSTGARVSQYAPWIKGIYKDVRLLSNIQGCIISKKTGAEYCLSSGQRSAYTLPNWILGDEVSVKTRSGIEVLLSDYANLSYNRIAGFKGNVDSNDLKNQKAWNGQYLDFNYPRSMRVR